MHSQYKMLLNLARKELQSSISTLYFEERFFGSQIDQVLNEDKEASNYSRSLFYFEDLLSNYKIVSEEIKNRPLSERINFFNNMVLETKEMIEEGLNEEEEKLAKENIKYFNEFYLE